MGRQGRELTTNAPLRSIFHILCIRNELGLPPKRMNPPSSRIVGAFLHSGYLAAAEQSRQNSNKLTGSEGRRRRSGWRLSARRSRSSTRAVTRSSSSGTNGRTPSSLAIASASPGYRLSRLDRANDSAMPTDRLARNRPDQTRAVEAGADGGSPRAAAVRRPARSPAHPRAERTDGLQVPSRLPRLPPGTGSADWTGRTTPPCRPIGSRGIARARGGLGRTRHRAHSDVRGLRGGRSPFAL